MPATSAEAAPGADFGKGPAINDASGRTPGSFEVVEGQLGRRQFPVFGGDGAPASNAQPYQCPKYHAEPFNSANVEQAGALHEASLTVASRDNTREYIGAGEWQGVKSSGAPYWEQAGHWGTYTCNPLTTQAPHGYRILVRGRYQFDQTAPAPYAFADAECATGYPAGPNDDTARYIPSDYRYEIKRIGNGPNRGPEWNPFGAEWKPSRFEWVGVNDASPDRFDVRLDLRTYTWRPLYPRGVSADPAVAGDPRCSDSRDHDPGDNDDAPDHIYVLDPNPATPEIEPYFLHDDPANFHAEPLLFSITDLITYNEWDNCGLLQAKVDRQSSPARIEDIRQAFESRTLSFAAPPEQQCHWWADDSAGNITASAAAVSVGQTRYQYVPSDLVVEPWRKTAESPRWATELRFTNNDPVPHTLTALVDVDGQDCVTADASLALNPDACGGTSGSGAPGARFFDSSPGCVDEQQISAGTCVMPRETRTVAIPDPERWTAGFRDERCNDGYCLVPFYCKILRHNAMTGTLVISDPRTPSVDVAPTHLAIGDASVVEGGTAQVEVSLFPADGSQRVTVRVDTADAGARANGDYTAVSGNVTFEPDPNQQGLVRTQTIQVATGADSENEGDERFVVRLSNATNAGIADGEATVTIVEESSPNAVRNLFAMPGPDRGDVTLRWSGPEAGAPSRYRIRRDEAVIAEVPVVPGQGPEHTDHLAVPSEWSAAHEYAVTSISGSPGVESERVSVRARPFPASAPSFEELVVPSNNPAGVQSQQPLVAGATYLLEVSGRFFYSGDQGRWADATCIVAPGQQQPTRLPLLLVGGRAAWDAASGGPGCDPDSTYRWVITAPTTGRVQFRIQDCDGCHGDNVNNLTVRIYGVVTNG